MPGNEPELHSLWDKTRTTQTSLVPSPSPPLLGGEGLGMSLSCIACGTRRAPHRLALPPGPSPLSLGGRGWGRAYTHTTGMYTYTVDKVRPEADNCYSGVQMCLLHKQFLQNWKCLHSSWHTEVDNMRVDICCKIHTVVNTGCKKYRCLVGIYMILRLI